MNSLTKAALLVFFFSLCASAAFVTKRVRDHSSPPPASEVYAVVNRQIAAFRSRDFPGAYRYAASGVQQKFTLPQFERMIRRNYPGLAGADRIEFGAVRVHGASATVQVFFINGSTTARSFIYTLIAEDGAWKIDGAEEVRVQPARTLSGLHA